MGNVSVKAVDGNLNLFANSVRVNCVSIIHHQRLAVLIHNLGRIFKILFEFQNFFFYLCNGRGVQGVKFGGIVHLNICHLFLKFCGYGHTRFPYLNRSYHYHTVYSLVNSVCSSLVGVILWIWDYCIIIIEIIWQQGYIFSRDVYLSTLVLTLTMMFVYVYNAT